MNEMPKKNVKVLSKSIGSHALNYMPDLRGNPGQPLPCHVKQKTDGKWVYLRPQFGAS